jgi:hypothetical protein
MKMENEILEVEMELGNGSIQKMFIQEVDSSDWDEIVKGTKGLLSLVNGQQMLIEINSADYEGVSFKIIGESQSFFYDEEVINSLFIEVEPSISDN